MLTAPLLEMRQKLGPVRKQTLQLMHQYRAPMPWRLAEMWLLTKNRGDSVSVTMLLLPRQDSWVSVVGMVEAHLLH